MKNLITLILLIGCCSLMGQNIDPNFNPSFRIAGNGFAVAAQADDKILVTGSFTAISGNLAQYLARMLPNGELDTSFQYPEMFTRGPSAVQLQADGKIIIGGRFINQEERFVGNIFRLLPDGQLDDSFQPIVIDSVILITNIAILPNQKIFVSTHRRNPAVTSNANVNGMRLYTKDGAIDPYFQPTEFTKDLTQGSRANIANIKVQSDNALIVGGSNLEFESLIQSVYRFDSTGAVDPSFNPTINSSTNFTVQNFDILEDGTMGFLGSGSDKYTILDSIGNIIVSGTITVGRNVFFDGTITATSNNSFLIVGSKLTQIFPNGNVVGGTEIGSNDYVFGITSQSNQQAIAVGIFTTFNGRYTPGIVRINISDATPEIDTNFKGQILNNGTVSAIQIQEDGKIIAGGNFNFVNGQQINHLVRLNKDGSVDSTFNLTNTSIFSKINQIEQLSTGDLIIGGTPGGTLKGLDILDKDGTFNNKNNFLFPFRGHFSQHKAAYLTIGSDDIFYAGENGSFYRTQNLVRYELTDNSEPISNNYADSYIDDLYHFNGLLTQEDNKLLIYGHQIQYHGSDTSTIVRANIDGSRDLSFQPNIPKNLNALTAVSVDSSSIFVGGTNNREYLSPAFLYKLNKEGQQETSFTANFMSPISNRSDVSFLGILPNDQLIVQGNFNEFNGQLLSSNKILIDTDGNFIKEFLPSLSTASFQEIKMIDESSYYLAGTFTSPTGAVGLMRIQDTTEEETFSIGGKISNFIGEPIEVVQVHTVNKEDSLLSTTTSEGTYQLMRLPKESDWTIHPFKSDQTTKDISTFDIVLILNHILGRKNFTNPYQHIAADINKSGSITLLDIVQMQQLILGIKDVIPPNDTWRFVLADYIFPEGNPLSLSYPSIGEIISLDRPYDSINFIGIKTGNVSGNSSSFHTGISRRQRKIPLQVTNQIVQKGVTYQLSLQLNSSDFLDGFQYALQLKDLQLLSINKKDISNSIPLQEEGLIWNYTKEGILLLSQVGKTFDKQTIQLTIKANHTTYIKDLIGLSRSSLKAEAYSVDQEIIDIDLVFTYPITNTDQLYQNRPNPFHYQTIIPFSLSEAGPIQLTLFDINGRIIQKQKQEGTVGYQEWPITIEDYQGVLFYELTTSKRTFKEKMLIVGK